MSTSHKHVRFAGMVKEILKQKGWEQKDLAAKLAVSPSYVSKVCRGSVTLSRERIYALQEKAQLDSAVMTELLILAGHDESKSSSGETVHTLQLVLKNPHFDPLLSPPGRPPIDSFVSAVYGYLQGREHQFDRQWEKTAQECVKAQALLQNASAHLQAYIADVLGNAYMHCGRLDEAETIYRQLETPASLDLGRDTYIRGQILTHRGELARISNRWDEALDHFRQAMIEFDTAGDETKKHRLQRKIALIHLARGNWRDAQPGLADAREYFEKTKNNYELAKVYMALGWMHSIDGNWDEAKRIRAKAREFAFAHRILGDVQREDKYLRLQACLYHGFVLRMVGELDESLSELLEAERLSKEVNDTRERGMILFGIARTHLDRCISGVGNWDAAHEYFRASMEHNRGDASRQARTELFFGVLHVHRKQYAEGITYLERAKSKFTTMEHTEYPAEAAIHLAEPYLRVGQHPDTIIQMLDEQIAQQQYRFGGQLARLQLKKALILHKHTGQDLDMVTALLADALYRAATFNKYVARHIWEELRDKLLRRQTRKTQIEMRERMRTRFAQRTQLHEIDFTAVQRAAMNYVEHQLQGSS